MSGPDRTGQFCLTTLEYAIQSSCSLSTRCPSCGLRLVIRYDSFVNRATSLGLLIGISALIGYHIGANRSWFEKLARRVFWIFNCDSERKNSTASDRLNVRTLRRILRGQRQFSPSCESDSIRPMANFSWSSPSLMEIITDDRDSPPPPYPGISVHQSRTVDKIDQVLHQIDDIKKSIVEIDDDLYQVTGSTGCDTFNPDYFTLTDMYDDDNDDNEFVDDDDRYPVVRHHRRKPKRRRWKNLKRIPENQEPEQIDLHEDFHQLSFESNENLPSLEWDESICDFLTENSPESIVQSEMTEEQKLRNMNELLEEAKRLGLLNNIIDAFLHPPDGGLSLTKSNDDDDDDQQP